MKPRNLVILSIVFLMSFAVARMLMSVSRAERLGPETTLASTANVVATDAASAPQRNGAGAIYHFVVASPHFETFFLLLLGSVLLAVASGIKVAQSRRVR